LGLEGGGGLKKQENKDEEKREETFEWGKHTANEGPVRIQYKMPGFHLCIPRNGTVIFKSEL
jgi:hypothetical protein